MHELSIAEGIVSITKETCEKENIHSVSKICLEIGDLAGIQLESLNYVWPLAVEGTLLEKAKVNIETIDGMAKCQHCHHTFKLEHLYDGCPKCGNFAKDILQGKELIVKSLEV